MIRWPTRAVLCGLGLAMVPATAFAATDAAAPGASEPVPDILVTARRRSEPLQAIPLAVTVADADALQAAHAGAVADLEAISPSISFRTANLASSTANLIVRGLGTTGSNRTFEGSVGIFVDGVYRSRGAAALQDFLDVGDVQMLRGPQSTLFGKNTTAGAVLVFSVAPSPDRAGATAEASYGSYASYLVRAAVNLPLSDKAALRVSGLATHGDGFYTDVTRHRPLNSSTTQAGKLQLLLEPGEDVSLRVIADYSRGHGNCCYATSLVTVGPLQPLIESLIVAGGGTVPSRQLRDREQSLNGDGHQVVEDYGAALIAEIATAGGTLRATTGYRHYRIAQTDMDPDFSGADIFRYDESFRSRFVSQELTWSAQVAPLHANVLVGGYFSDERLTMGRRLPWGTQAQAYWDVLLGGLGLPAGTVDAPPGLISEEAMGGSARTWSAFAHADMQVAEGLHLTAGLRYSREQKTGRFAYAYFRPSPAEPFRFLGVQPGPAYAARRDEGAVGGTLALEYRLARNAHVYATYNHGFKSGGINIDANGAGTVANNPAEVPGARPLDPSFAPETIDAFELGGKFTWDDGRGRTNLALFRYDIHSLQIAQFVGTRTTVINAQGAVDEGVEIENRWQVLPRLTLDADATWIPHARYGTGDSIDPVLAGSRFRFTPRIAANLAARIEQPVLPALNLTGRVQYRYRSAQLVDTAGTARQGPVSLVDLDLGIALPQAGLRIDAGVRNLFDTAYAEQVLATPLQAGSASGFLGAPRTFSLRVQKTF